MRFICCDSYFRAFPGWVLVHEPSSPNSLFDQPSSLRSMSNVPYRLEQLAESIRVSMLAGQADNAALGCRPGCKECSRGNETPVASPTLSGTALSSLSNAGGATVSGADKTGEFGELQSLHAESIWRQAARSTSTTRWFYFRSSRSSAPLVSWATSSRSRRTLRGRDRMAARWQLRSSSRADSADFARTLNTSRRSCSTWTCRACASRRWCTSAPLCSSRLRCPMRFKAHAAVT